MTLIIILNVALMSLVFVGIVSFLGVGIVSDRRWAAALSGPVRGRTQARVGAREVAGRRVPRHGYVPVRGDV